MSTGKPVTTGGNYVTSPDTSFINSGSYALFGTTSADILANYSTLTKSDFLSSANNVYKLTTESTKHTTETLIQNTGESSSAKHSYISTFTAVSHRPTTTTNTVKYITSNTSTSYSISEHTTIVDAISTAPQLATAFTVTVPTNIASAVSVYQTNYLHSESTATTKNLLSTSTSRLDSVSTKPTAIISQSSKGTESSVIDKVRLNITTGVTTDTTDILAGHSNTVSTSIFDTDEIPLNITNEFTHHAEKESKFKCCCSCRTINSLLPCGECLADTRDTAAGCAMDKVASAQVYKTTEPPDWILLSEAENKTKYSENFLQNEELLEYLSTLPEAEKQNLGFELSDIVTSCRFQGEECDMEKDFVMFNNPVYGNCFIFNSGWTQDEDIKQTDRHGNHNGLEMSLYIDQENYVRGAGDTAGISISVLDQNIMPFPEDIGIIVSPGYKTYLALVETTEERSPPPYGDCVEDDLNSTYRDTIYAARYPVLYSVLTCWKTCYQRHLVDECGCHDPRIIEPKGHPDDLGVCSAMNVTQDLCVERVFTLFSTSRLGCNCPERCRDSQFNFHSSRILWPSASAVEKSISYDTGVYSDIETFRENVVKIEIYFENSVVMDISEAPAYKLTRYLADLGGIFGLWFGCPVMSFLEVGELVLDVLLTIATHRKP